MKVYFIRHGKTPGNLLRRYIGGRTDQSLCEAGKAELTDLKDAHLYPAAKRVYVSPMRRCRETAAILFPLAQQIVVEAMREMDFGRFENRSHDDMKHDSDYNAWISTMCEGPIPQGENKESFTTRCAKAFIDITKSWKPEVETEPAVFVVHGGTIMAILSTLVKSDRSYYNWYTPNGHGYLCDWDGEKLIFKKEI
ncbi:MAG: histidine phosphatase family protein [Spirochaetia bacterium]|nr:histidine phosphatase family protein [Spirochaetia bacterium]